jgi:hypothetical protein
MSAPSPRAPRATADAIAAVRRSIVGVRALSSAGTGWVVLSNGLVLTSHEAVGYQIEVFLELESGRRSGGRVIWTDVSRDLALILPIDPLSLPPLTTRPDLPKLGELALSLCCIPGQAFRVGSCLVSAIDRKIGTIRCFEVDAAVNSLGGPIIDLDGRVIGIGGLDLPRGSRRMLASSPERFSPALPITALQRALAAFDLPAEQFQGRSPTYRCAGCGEPYAIEHERCFTCGQRLPHSWEIAGTTRGTSMNISTSAASSFSIAERLVGDILAVLGALTTNVRIGPRTWRLLVPGGGSPSSPMIEVLLMLDEQGTVLSGRMPLVRIPQSNHESFYRFLLTLNDQTLGRLRASIEGSIVYLSFAETTVALKDTEAADLFEELVRTGQHYRKALGEPFDTKPAV